MRNRILLYLLAAGNIIGCSPAVEDYVNPLQGTMSIPSFSTGNTYPAVAVPWGMNFWTAQTRENENGWQYVYSDSKICGFKQTHQPSPWINDYGCFSVMPICGDLVLSEVERASGFDHNDETSHPYYYGVRLSSGIEAEMTPTRTGAVMRFKFPKNKAPYIVIDCFSGGAVDVGSDGEIMGFSSYYSKNNKAELPDNFATHFVMKLDAPIRDWGKSEVNGRQCAWLLLDAGSTGVVELGVASSFISLEQARTNYAAELDGRTFGSVMSDARKMWRKELGIFDVSGGTEEQKRTFYTALYRTMLFPREIYEYDADGTPVHYDFFNGGVKPGYMYADNGFWDTFRSVHPLFTIIHPSMSARIMKALLNIYHEGGWLPEWFSPAYKDCMVGQHSVSVITDAFLKGICDYDAEEMYGAFVKCAHAEGPKATGRLGCGDYDRLGYVPSDNGVQESVSRTLEYAYNDYCIGLYAKALGKEEEAGEYFRRARNYRNVFDENVNFVRPRRLDGSWEDGWTPDTWGGAFTEGSSWHWTWCVYHDPKGLMELMGGEEVFVSKLDSVFTVPPTFRSSYYKREIHEMTEMVAGDMGQYAHGNQPVQHMIYFYDYAGVPYKAQKHLREVMDKLYSSGIQDGKGLCGDEDNGQTSAWYVFGASGFYPVCPGSLEYAIGSPLFEKIRIRLENGKHFVVKAAGNSSRNVYIQSAKLNGKELRRSYLTHSEIMNGGTLELVMGCNPNKEWGRDPDCRPHSMNGK